MVGRPVSSDGGYQFLIECSLHTHPTTETSIFHYIIVENARQWTNTKTIPMFKQ